MEVSLRKPTMFRLRTDLIEQLKVAAKRQNRSLNNYVESVLMNTVYNEPNAETRAAIEEAARGNDLPPVDTSSFDAFCKSLE